MRIESRFELDDPKSIDFTLKPKISPNKIPIDNTIDDTDKF